jgi:hypothetical protein
MIAEARVFAQAALAKSTGVYFPNVASQRHEFYSKGIDPDAIEPER